MWFNIERLTAVPKCSVFYTALKFGNLWNRSDTNYSYIAVLVRV